MTPAQADRPFGLTSATCLVVANMVGAGVFTTSGLSLAQLGRRDLVLLAWLLGGLIALCGALSYGALSRHISESGGEYVFLSRAVHPAVGFLAGWVSLIAGFTGAIAFAATTFEAYALPERLRPESLPPGTVAVAVIAVLWLLHSLVLRPGLIAQNAVVALKLVLLGTFMVYAAIAFSLDSWKGPGVQEPPSTFSLAAFASGLVWISLSYSGFNAPVYVAGEVVDARRTVPRAMWLGTLIVMGVYLGLNAIFLYAATPAEVSGQEDVAAVAAAAIGGRALSVVVRIGICLALLTSVSSMIVAGPRVYAQMADDGIFPRIFRRGRPGSASPDSQSPRAAIALQAVLAIVVVCATTLARLLEYLGLTLSLSAAGAVACIFLLQRRSARPERPPGYPVVPSIFILSTLTLAALSVRELKEAVVGALATFASGLAAYFLFKHFRSEPGESGP